MIYIANFNEYFEGKSLAYGVKPMGVIRGYGPHYGSMGETKKCGKNIQGKTPIRQQGQ